MKLNPTFNKLPLIALLTLGLVCSPLVVNADNGDRGRHGHYQPDYGKPHHIDDHHSDHRGNGHRKHHDYRNSCNKHYKHAYKSVHHHDRPQGQHRHYTSVQRHYREEQHPDRFRYFPGSYFGSLAILFQD